MDNGLPEDSVSAPKHVRAILMSILTLFLRQSLVHSLVNKKNFDKDAGTNVKKSTE